MQTFHSRLLNNYPNLLNCFTTKTDGNLAFHVNDDPKNVLKNHQQLAKKLAFQYKKLSHMKQIHSDIVKIVTKHENFDNPPTCDAIITNQKEIPLLVMVADCSPILFFDPKKEVIAVAHAGRAGAFANIVHNVIESFIKDFGSQTKDILVSVGPAISQKCYEVNSEIAKEAHKLGFEKSIKKENEKYFLDIRSILKKELLEAEVKPQHIEISQICSQCNPHYFSYREDKKCGRFGAVIALQ